MRIEHFRYAFKRLNGFYLKEHIILFRKPLELWNELTGESITFKTLDEVLDYELAGETVRDIIERTDTLYLPPLNGGRGAGDGTQSTFKFGSASGDGKDKSHNLLPAQANVRIKSKTPEGAMAEFRAKHGNSDHEWAYEIDSNGYVHQYVEGNAHSVAISSRAKVGKGQSTMILHNHPSGGHFSDADLISTAMDARSRGIVATSTKAQYTFEKGTHFKATQFVKAVKSAKLKGTSYDDAVDKWLNGNAKKYGYKYTKQNDSKFKGVKRNAKATAKKTKLTKTQISNLSRAKMESLAKDIYIKKSMSQGLSKSEADYRFRSLISSNSKTNLIKYIYKNQ